MRPELAFLPPLFLSASSGPLDKTALLMYISGEGGKTNV